MASQIDINLVPNEILIAILGFLPSRALLPLAAVNRRFNSVILRIIRQRLVQAVSLPDRRLILECYRPEAKLTTPYLYCDYRFTEDLDDSATKRCIARGQDPPDLTLAALAKAYSHFRPVKQEENRRGRRRYPSQSEAQAEAQDAVTDEQESTSSTADSDSSASSNSSTAASTAATSLPDPPSDDVFLDGGEFFSQFCTVTNLVKVGPRPGLFLSHVNVNDGLIRVWRHWLEAQAADGSVDAQAPILWADHQQTVGVRFRVEERMPGWDQMVTLVDADMHFPVAYRLEFKELVVRAGPLLLAVEASEKQEVTTSGKAIVIASI